MSIFPLLRLRWWLSCRSTSASIGTLSYTFACITWLVTAFIRVIHLKPDVLTHSFKDGRFILMKSHPRPLKLVCPAGVGVGVPGPGIPAGLEHNFPMHWAACARRHQNINNFSPNLEHFLACFGATVALTSLLSPLPPLRASLLPPWAPHAAWRE